MDMHRPVWVKLSLVFPGGQTYRCPLISLILGLSTLLPRCRVICSSGYAAPAVSGWGW